MTAPPGVHGGAVARIADGDTAYVFAGGLVEATGGRVLVGTGGRCVATGTARVWLVEDGQPALLGDRPAPAAAVDGGELFADCGVAALRGAARYRATGTATVLAAASVTGTVEDGREVQVERIDEEAYAEHRARLLAGGPAVPWPAEALATEPEGSVAAWLDPLVVLLVADGARVRDAGVVETGGDVAEALRSLLARVALPPTVRLVVRGDEAELLTDFGPGLRLRRRPRGTLSRLFGGDR